MGPSGCGKSTLMNILAGYRVKGCSGDILINGKIRNIDIFKEQSSYIMQDDNLQPLLTVGEAMSIAAHLKLGKAFSHRDKKLRVKELLEFLDLWDSRRVRTKNLSGGQKKRLAIALELVKNPQVVLLDEPTSGLDSVTSKNCVELLKGLSGRGKTVICIIHQPSASIFEMFDHLYVMAKGMCMYQGSVSYVLQFLEEHNLRCPPYHNPADYLIEIASGEHDANAVERLVKGCSNGRFSLEYLENHISKEDFIISNNNSTAINDNSIPSLMRLPSFVKATTTKEVIVEKTKSCFRSRYPTSFPDQLLVLLKRTFKIVSRDPTLMYNRLLTHIFIALLLGTLYYGIGRDAKDIRNNSNFLFFTVMFLMLTAFNCVTTTFPTELPIIKQECFNGWYAVKSYFLAVTLADIPIQILATHLYAGITYFMTAQPFDLFRITYFVTMCTLISLVSQSFGLIIGASMGVKNGVIFGPFCFLPFTIFSGFFVQLNSAPFFLRWIFHISFLKYGFEGLMLSIFGYDRGKIPCSSDYCHFVYPKMYLDALDMEDAVYKNCVLFMIFLIVLMRFISYYLLYLRLK
ncbi:ATP-binding cassette sub-family G member 1 isoform X2 [Agrilus planipennis]|nr:ATP-binding cassette sub-family G member 1 isoform X2 [Agrilus planipennis]